MVGEVGFTFCGSSFSWKKGAVFENSRVDPPKEFQDSSSSLVYGTMNNSVEDIIAGINGLDKTIIMYKEIETTIASNLQPYKHPTKS